MSATRKQYESTLADYVKSNTRRFFAHVRRKRQRIMTLRVEDGAVMTNSENLARILAVGYVPVFRNYKGKDTPSLPEPPTIMCTPLFTQAAVHKRTSTLDTAKGTGPVQFHSFILQFLADS